MNGKVLVIGVILATVAAGLALGLGCGADTFVLYAAGRVALLLALPLLALALGSLVVVRSWRAPRSKGISTAISVLAAAGLFFVLLTPASWVGGKVANWRSEQAMAGITATVGPLDGFRTKFGRYPETLQEADAAGFPVPVPDMACRAGFYHPSPSRQKFMLVLLSAKPCTDCVYDAASGRWFDCKGGYGGSWHLGE
jgi:hypothetical protein